jgi:hypothetical protein
MIRRAAVTLVCALVALVPVAAPASAGDCFEIPELQFKHCL